MMAIRKVLYLKENEEDSEISYECWIDYNSIDDKPLCIGLRNNNSYEKTALLFSEKVTLSPYEYKTFRNPLKEEEYQYKMDI